MGIHHAWGRTFKDVVQRYRALCGYEQRFQNGFDCQGLWVEVEVENTLGFDSKREIESFGLDRFSRACRERVMHFAAVQTERSKRLGQWMDWPNSYFTMSDANIEYNWTFLKRCHERGWSYMGHRPMPWCTRCGTSISQHEMLDAYAERTHESPRRSRSTRATSGGRRSRWSCAAALRPRAGRRERWASRRRGSPWPWIALEARRKDGLAAPGGRRYRAATTRPLWAWAGPPTASRTTAATCPAASGRSSSDPHHLGGAHRAIRRQ